MLRNLIILPDGTEIFSGPGTVNAICSTGYTACVNNGTELTPGSVCAAMAEFKLFTPAGNLNIAAGQEITLFSVDDAGKRIQTGIFRLETPERPSRNIYKLTAYDRVVLLDRDLTEWLKGLDGWPYLLRDFAGMVCAACGLTLAAGEIPNGDYPVEQFAGTGITGRRLMEWIGQIACRFVRATPEGEVEFAWYTSSGLTLGPTGAGSHRKLKYDDYQVQPVEAVQIRLADSADGYLWPEAAAGANAYMIYGNPLMSRATEAVLPYLAVIRRELAGCAYTPCTFTAPAALGLQAGQTVDLVDGNGKTITALVMKLTRKGQMAAVECTGSPRRESATNVNNPTVKDLKEYADAAVRGQSQEDIFNKLTKNGTVEGIYLVDGKLYIDASVLQAGIINAVVIGLSGKFSVYDGEDGVKGGHIGYLPGSQNGETTDGIGVSDATEQCYFIATAAGVRGQAGSVAFYLQKDGRFVVEGDVLINGNLIVNGTIDHL